MPAVDMLYPYIFISQVTDDKRVHLSLALKSDCKISVHQLSCNFFVNVYPDNYANPLCRLCFRHTEVTTSQKMGLWTHQNSLEVRQPWGGKDILRASPHYKRCKVQHGEYPI